MHTCTHTYTFTQIHTHIACMYTYVHTLKLLKKKNTCGHEHKETTERPLRPAMNTANERIKIFDTLEHSGVVSFLASLMESPVVR